MRYFAFGIGPIISGLLIGSAAYGGDVSPVGSPLADEGRALYSGQCARCHGANMVNNGLVGFDLRKFPKEDRERFVNSVREGKPPNMPPWGDVFSDHEIEALWAYVRAGSAL